MREREPSSGYSCWCAVASYFDGDGSVEFETAKLTLRFRLSWTDNYRQQVEQIKRFLERNGLAVGRIIYARGAFHLVVGQIKSMKLAAREMLRSGCVYKKRLELSALLDYYDNSLTGDRVVREFNRSVRLGIRSGFLRDSHLPLTYESARRLQAKLAGEGATRVRQKVDSALELRVINQRSQLGLSVKELANLHHLGTSTVSRILREPLKIDRLGRTGEQETLD